MWLGFSVEFWAGTVIGLAGIFIPMFFSRARQRGRIALAITQSASLMSEVAREVPNLKVLYADKEIEHELIWISGIIVNVGRSDVGRSVVAQFPRLLLTEPASWQEFSILNAQAGQSQARLLTQNEVEIQWTLLKPFESIAFAALVSTEDHDLVNRLRLGKDVQLFARIENCEFKFSQEFSAPLDTKAVRWSFIGNVSLALVVIAGIIFGTIGLQSALWPTPIRYHGPQLSGQELKQENAKFEKDMRNLDGIEKLNRDPDAEKFLSEIKLNRKRKHDFLSKPSTGPELYYPEVATADKVFFSVFWLFGLALAVYSLYDARRDYRRFRYLSGGAPLVRLFFNRRRRDD